MLTFVVSEFLGASYDCTYISGSPPGNASTAHSVYVITRVLQDHSHTCLSWVGKRVGKVGALSNAGYGCLIRSTERSYTSMFHVQCLKFPVSLSMMALNLFAYSITQSASESGKALHILSAIVDYFTTLFWLHAITSMTFMCVQR